MAQSMSPRSTEAAISALAAAQHGVVARHQLLRAGIGPDAIEWRLEVGRLVALHRGIYRVGPILAPGATEMAAALACGPGAVVSHRGAAVLWELLPDPGDASRAARLAHASRVGQANRPGRGSCAGQADRAGPAIRVGQAGRSVRGSQASEADDAGPASRLGKTSRRDKGAARRGRAHGAIRPCEVDVIVPGHAHRRPGIRTHRIRTVRPDETTWLDGIPLTTPARTLYDLSGSASTRDVERALAEALARRLVTRAALEELLRHHPRGPGTRTLRALLRAGDPARTRSEAEERFLALIRGAGIDQPAVNASVGAYEVDFLWRSAGLVVEVDGYQFHSSHRAFERDRRRDAALAAAGFRVARVTWRQMTDEPLAVIARLAQALARTALPADPRGPRTSAARR